MPTNIGAGNISKIRMKESAAPSAPASGYQYWRLGTDHHPYIDLASGVHAPVLPMANALLNGAKGDGTTDDTAAITGLLASGKSVYLPAGTYKITGTGAVIASANNGQWIVGDGMGKTILKYPAGTLNTYAYMIRLTGQDQGVRDLTIYAETLSGSGNWWGISAYTPCLRPTISRVEIYGAWGNDTAGGEGIDLYQPYNNVLFATTLGTVIAAGTRTVTPGSMRGIYVGRRLSIGGTAETIIVTATTATTFSAVFANAHGASDTVTGLGWGYQGALIQDCHIHDCPAASGIVTSSNGNRIIGNRVIACGNNATRHGMYINSGYTVLAENYVEGSGGYNYHMHNQATDLDNTGLLFTGNKSVNPVTGHFTVDSVAATGANPNLPSGTQGTRAFQMIGNVFRCDKDFAGNSIGVWFNGVAGSIEGNLFEDTIGASGSGNAYLDCHLAPGCSVTGANTFRTINAPSAGYGCYLAANSVFAGNVIDNLAASYGVYTGGDDCQVLGNQITMIENDSYLAVQINHNRPLVADNYLASSRSGVINVTDGTRDFEIRGNRFYNNYTTNATGWDILINGDNPNATGAFHDNAIIRGRVGINHNVGNIHCWNNIGPIVYDGSSYIACKTEMGRLLGRPYDASTAITAGFLCKLDSSGNAVRVGTGDTVFACVSLNGLSSGTGQAHFAGLPGTIATVEIDGAWSEGHVMIISSGTAGKGHDNGGATPPTAPASYGVFMDTGGGAGQARVLIVKGL